MINDTNTNENTLTPGTIIQYRKVGTFEIVGPSPDGPRSEAWERGDGWYVCVAVKAPKKYREAPHEFWVGPEDVVG